MDLRKLLDKYISGKIKGDDFRLLREYTHKTSDENLDTIFEALWREAERKPMDINIKKEVKETLGRRLAVPQRKSIFKWKNIAVAIVLPLLIFSTTYLFITSKLTPEQQFVIKSAKGQKTQIYLPDGTKVWLNSNSHISYNSNYNHNNRTVLLRGEAFFEVEKNESSKFIVDIGDVAVVVHGTAFNITAYENDSIASVSLNRGKINIENISNHYQIATLIPNQEILINRNNLSSELRDCDAELNSLWTQDRLKLDDVNTEVLFKKMEHWYGVNISISNINPDYVYSVTIKTESLREMLDLINKLTPITYTINGEEVRVIYKR